MLAEWLDRVLYRHPFEGTSARRYATAERPAFTDSDRRLLESIAPNGARCLLDLGCGPATFASLAAAHHPGLRVIAIDPSRDFARRRDAVLVVRATGEMLPLATASVDVAVCLSSIRHMRDRHAALVELRRVVRPGGRLVVVELDPAADARRIATHAARLGSAILQHAFGPLVVRTAPSAAVIEATAAAAGWRRCALRDDPVQPVYVMELT